MWQSGFTTEKPIDLGLLLAERSRYFYNRMLKSTYAVVSEWLKQNHSTDVKIPRILDNLGRTCQETELPVLLA